MPKFKAGQIVKLKEYKFSPLPEEVRVVLAYEEDNFPCTLCDDPNCYEWSNALGEDGRWYWHVSECQLEPIQD